ncbi:MAG: histidine phosphatase family protein [Dehalococcoidia bacterium]|nr:histidine phosphatase family protein [Dehalococcoidia bacterium]
MTLLLVRHGESTGNAERLIQGWLDVPLTPLGRRQAAAVAARLASAGASALYSSPLRRARETADAVAAATRLAVVEVDALREYHFGEAQGLRYEDAAARWGRAERGWGVGQVPGEEGLPAFRARVGAGIAELAARHTTDIAIAVLHGGVLGAIVAELCALPPDVYAQVYTANCGLTTLVREQGRDVIATYNDHCHLEGINADVEERPDELSRAQSAN